MSIIIINMVIILASAVVIVIVIMLCLYKKFQKQQRQGYRRNANTSQQNCGAERTTHNDNKGAINLDFKDNEHTTISYICDDQPTAGARELEEQTASFNMAF